MTKTQPDYSTLASSESVDKAISALKKKGYFSVLVSNKEEALNEIKKLIPKGASVMNGGSVTLEQIGYQDYLTKGEHKWRDLHAEITAENNTEKRHELRKLSSLSDFYLGSVHALTEDGNMVIASNTGSQLAHLVFTSPNLILVVSTKKIVPNLDEAMKRLENYVVPLEEKHMQENNMHTAMNKVLIFRGEASFTGRKIHIILVKEDLGF